MKEKASQGKAPNLTVEFLNETWYKTSFEYADYENHNLICGGKLRSEL